MSTHSLSDPATAVFNQSEPLVDWNLFRGEPTLVSALKSWEPDSPSLSNLEQFGEILGRQSSLLKAKAANEFKPQLKTHDSKGRRLDQVEFHPAYHELMTLAAGHGLAAAPFVVANSRPLSHLVRGIKFLMMSGIESSVLCPISMTYSVVPALEYSTDLLAQLLPKLGQLAYDPSPIPWQQKSSITMGMGMTEKQGGSDVRANITIAIKDTAQTDWWRITGHKWFFSAPMCDAFLILAQTSQGLSCFFLPSYLEDGQRNHIYIQRLKNKLGNQANASSEVEFRQAKAQLVGLEGQGIKTILEMGTMTRIDCSLGTAGLMRQSVALALDHCRQRIAFGKPLLEQPAMQQVLADLALESEAATWLALRLAVSMDRRRSEHEAQLRRILTPSAKFWICKRGSHLAQETMECLGGNGYTEDEMMARIYREMPLNSIWEGAGNVMGLDVLRSLSKRDGLLPTVLKSLMDEVSPSLNKSEQLSQLANYLINLTDDCLDQGNAQGRFLAQSIAVLMQGHLLTQHSPEFVAAAFCKSRIDSSGKVRAPAVFGMSAINRAEDIVRRALPR